MNLTYTYPAKTVTSTEIYQGIKDVPTSIGEIFGRDGYKWVVIDFRPVTPGDFFVMDTGRVVDLPIMGSKHHGDPRIIVRRARKRRIIILTETCEFRPPKLGEYWVGDSGTIYKVSTPYRDTNPVSRQIFKAEETVVYE